MPETGERGGQTSPLPRYGEIVALAEDISAIIRRDGPVTFERFMEMCLYMPGKGYYSSGRETWGRGGDYITSMDVSSAFAGTIARELHEMWVLLGEPSPFVLVEAGAGRGWLTKGIEESIERISPGLNDAVRFAIVEKNPALREPKTEKKAWYSDIFDVPPFDRGCVLSNELIDSFPVHKVVFTGGSLKEVYVGHDGSGFIETAGPLSNPDIEGYFPFVGVEPFEGMTTEVNLRAIKWIEKASELFHKGFVITIDYGLTAMELYAPERKGTLMCHYRHTLNDNPYINVGEQDMTTHADFTALVNAGLRAGLSLTGFTTQKNFLLGLGILEELKAPEGAMPVSDDIAHNRAIAKLITPGGMGDTFKVLIQHKGMEKPALSGFAFKDMSRHVQPD